MACLPQKLQVPVAMSRPGFQAAETARSRRVRREAAARLKSQEAVAAAEAQLALGRQVQQVATLLTSQG